MLRVGNFFVSVSIEGFEEANDGRRGDGHFQRALAAMDRMRSYRIPFGVSICYTSRNYQVVTSDEFLDLLISKGCVFAWYFHYMPVGQNADTSLLLTPEQRIYMKNRVREIRGSQAEKSSTASISRTTASLPAAAWLAAGSTATSTPRATWSPASSFTTRAPTSRSSPSSSASSSRCSSSTARGSRSTTIICARVRCSKIRSCCQRW